MGHLITKDRMVSEIESLRRTTLTNFDEGVNATVEVLLETLNTFETKDADLEKKSLTWEDIRKLYVIFSEVDTEIEFCKTDIKPETIGYYKEVLKRFKS